MKSLTDSKIQGVLSSLHLKSAKDIPTIIKGFSRAMFRKLRPEDMAKAYIAITREQGELMYRIIRSKNARNIVEFGTSFGISTLYLAAGAKDTGGKVIGTEILPEKAAVAAQNFKDAGLEDLIDLRIGDALETLKDVPDGVDFVLLDGWNDLYLDVIKLLEPKLSIDAVVITDNAGMRSASPFINYIRNHDQYLSGPLKTDKGRTEYSVYIG